MSKELSDAMLEKLRKQAKRETLQEAQVADDSITPMDCSGGNFDDAWAGGEEDGATWLAREILADIGEE